jgi:F0F1-type ATP synthase alpha subunit
MSSILQEIEAQIAGVKTSVAKQNVGTVREISDGVATCRRSDRRHAERDARLRQRRDRPRPQP